MCDLYYIICILHSFHFRENYVNLNEFYKNIINSTSALLLKNMIQFIESHIIMFLIIQKYDK